jgi:hypothetical protein
MSIAASFAPLVADTGKAVKAGVLFVHERREGTPRTSPHLPSTGRVCRGFRYNGGR